MSTREFMILEAIGCLKEAADNLQRDGVCLFDQYMAIDKVINELREELKKEK